MRKSTLQRMLQLADIKPVIKESKITLSNFELVKESVNGKTYAIVRENNKYHIKEAQTKNGLTESDFNYVGGVMNKMKKSFHSYSDATKHLNLMFEEINNHHDVDVINILESDQLLNEKKFVLKLDKKKKSKPAPPAEEPVADEGGEEEEEFDFGGEEEGDTEGEEDFDFGAEEEGDTEETDVEEFGDEGDEDLELDDSDDEIKDIQSTTGKLGQQLRDVEDISSDMQKWVAKSVLSALDLDTMDSEDKKDIIKTIKKKEEEPTEEEGGDEEFGFGGEEEEMEESYDNYMGGDYDDDMDGMDGYNWDGVNVEDEFPSYEDVYEKDVEMRDIEMPIKNKRHLNLDPANTKNPYDDYDSYMEEKGFNEEAFDSFMDEMEELGITSKDSKYESYMEDIVGKPNPNDEYSPNRRTWESREEDTELGGDEKYRVAEPDEVGDDMLLLDIDEDMGPEEMDALYGPNSSRKYDRSEYSRSKRQADKEISKHYHKPSAPGYESDPVEKWAKHKLPYDMEFMGEGDYMNEDHLNDKMGTYEQEKAYEDVETVVRRYGMDVELREKQTSEDPEETLIYLDIVDGDKKLLVARINSVGDIEVGEMRGNKFSGEPVDSVEDFIEIFGEDLTSKERKDLDMVGDIEMSPAPQKAPEKDPSQPATKPGKPEKTPGKDRPSRRPFSPPPKIDPNDPDALPGPKAKGKKVVDDSDVEFE